MKHRLLRVVRRLFQYEALLTGGPPGGRAQRCSHHLQSFWSPPK